MSDTSTDNRLAFFATPPHTCSYLPERSATTLFADPNFPKSTRLYSLLSSFGFRRSGQHIYRPHCEACQACTPVRVSARDFSPRRSQRRSWRLNQDLQTIARGTDFRQDHFDLYRRYLHGRHRGSEMGDPTPKQYQEFLTSSWSRTTFFEFRLDGRLLAVSVTDRLEDGYSAVYTFFDPSFPRRGLGVFTILWQIAQAKKQGLEWLYLGYLIDESPKMRYKREYQPQERFVDGQWVRAPDRDVYD